MQVPNNITGLPVGELPMQPSFILHEDDEMVVQEASNPLPAPKDNPTSNTDLPRNPNLICNFKDKHSGPAQLITNSFSIVERILSKDFVKGNSCFQNHTDTSNPKSMSIFKRTIQ